MAGDLAAKSDAYPMYGKTKSYKSVSFHYRIYEEVLDAFRCIITASGHEARPFECKYEENGADISVKDPTEIYRKNCFSSSYFRFNATSKDIEESLYMNYINGILIVEIHGLSNLSLSNNIFDIFDNNYSSSKFSTEQALKNISVFIGHGRSRLWRDLKDHLQDHHGVRVVAYETGARAGYTIKEVLEEMSSQASLALLIHTGEDIDRDGQAHARENVVHETGLFQGKLGFRRAIVVLEEETNEFSNIAGLQQIRFQKGNIKEIFGDVLAIIRREMID